MPVQQEVGSTDCNVVLLCSPADLNNVRFSAYRTAMKLRRLQKALCRKYVPSAVGAGVSAVRSPVRVCVQWTCSACRRRASCSSSRR